MLKYLENLVFGDLKNPSEVKEFSELSKKHLSQMPKKLKNRKRRIKVYQGLIWLDFEGVTKYLDDLDINFIGRGENGEDCLKYSFGIEDTNELVPGIIRHNGAPEKGDAIIYMGNIKNPHHVGVYQGNGRVISMFGDDGPILEHNWNDVLLNYGKFALFSKYNGGLKNN